MAQDGLWSDFCSRPGNPKFSGSVLKDCNIKQYYVGVHLYNMKSTDNNMTNTNE